MTDSYGWHVASVRVGDGSRPELGCVHYVQRYLRDPSTRYTGEVLRQSFTAEADAQAVADRLNADPSRPFDARGTYL